ncbi:hypothetical protein JTE90_000817 [Oedothorax gibbosus]|uniref:N-acetyllactosaminide beta-1,3-N-acetylglucosaminyltransferase n=1 Tax=Oedothorax gibbosus TaxID=931172 RepID=A0AAV6VT98_9ARAC|nr:hypothetical protein JTE90_000817 [Oedothorax gibbosus]
MVFSFLCFFIRNDATQLGTIKNKQACGTSTNPLDKRSPDVVYKNYYVLSLYSDVERSNLNLGSVTLCTHGTIVFLNHISVLCQRWGGPIPVAVYSSASNYEDIRTLAATLRYCDFCVRHWVSWHFFGKQNFGDRQLFRSADSFQNTRIDCSALSSGKGTEKRKSEDSYPINVGRNIARQRTQTRYVFSLDIELYPSNNVLSKFERMIRSKKNITPNEVWVLPAFEIYPEYSSPRTKFQLKQMFTRRQAISFHMYKCNRCHMIPNLEGWLNQEVQWKSEVAEATESLRVWSTVKRNRKERLGDWEPFFIGTRDDPEFDIRLSWEGKNNKKQMAYEMCLRNYDFHIIDNAFLVHAPGIKLYYATIDKNRIKHIEENKKYMEIIRTDLEKMYGSTNSTDDC